MKKKQKAIEKAQLEKRSHEKDQALKMRLLTLRNKQNVERENFKKKILLELEIFEKEKLRNFDE